MKNLQLPLTKKWFDKTKSLEKTEDYRDITWYWFNRLVSEPKKTFKQLTGHNWNDSQIDKDALALDICTVTPREIKFKQFDLNIMTHGYPKRSNDAKFLRFKHTGIEIREGNPEWGAIEGVMYFVVKHGKPAKEITKVV